MKAWLVREPFDPYFDAAVSLDPPEPRADIVYATTRGRAIARSRLIGMGWFGFTEFIAHRVPDLDDDLPEGTVL